MEGLDDDWKLGSGLLVALKPVLRESGHEHFINIKLPLSQVVVRNFDFDVEAALESGGGGSRVPRELAVQLQEVLDRLLESPHFKLAIEEMRSRFWVPLDSLQAFDSFRSEISYHEVLREVLAVLQVDEVPAQFLSEHLRVLLLPEQLFGESGLMVHDELPVLGGVDIHIDEVSLLKVGIVMRWNGVLWKRAIVATMGNNERTRWLSFVVLAARVGSKEAPESDEANGKHRNSVH